MHSCMHHVSVNSQKAPMCVIVWPLCSDPSKLGHLVRRTSSCWPPCWEGRVPYYPKSRIFYSALHIPKNFNLVLHTRLCGLWETNSFRVSTTKGAAGKPECWFIVYSQRCQSVLDRNKHIDRLVCSWGSQHTGTRISAASSLKP